MSEPSFTFDTVADRLVDLAVKEPRIRALWIESDAPEELRRPYRRLEVHTATDEPQFPAFTADLAKILERAFSVEVEKVEDTVRFAKRFSLKLGERGKPPALPVVLIAEQSNLLAKRPRAYVVALCDKTGHLVHVMDFSKRRKRTSPA